MTSGAKTTPAAIRPARPDEAPALNALARRAKAHWGYDEAFLAAYRDALTVTPEDIAAHTTRVATLAGHPCGFYQLRGVGETAELTDLWVEPGVIGQGHGRALWEDAAAVARTQGFRALLVQSDPHAEGFYRAMGAERIGSQPSTVIAGLELPLLRLVLV
jgi:ribosomal protein S18 acetylase RimI-like enzyme